MELEIDRYREEVHSCQMETQQLREVAQGGQTRALIDTISELQVSKGNKKHETSKQGIRCSLRNLESTYTSVSDWR